MCACQIINGRMPCVKAKQTRTNIVNRDDLFTFPTKNKTCIWIWSIFRATISRASPFQQRRKTCELFTLSRDSQITEDDYDDDDDRIFKWIRIRVHEPCHACNTISPLRCAVPPHNTRLVARGGEHVCVYFDVYPVSKHICIAINIASGH